MKSFKKKANFIAVRLGGHYFPNCGGSRKELTHFYEDGEGFFRE
jgi:hypothetical protein